MINDQQTTEFMRAFRGSFTSTLRWPQLDELWIKVRADASLWYVYAIGEPPPENKASPDELNCFVDEIDELLRREHDEDYCGIVYADDLESPGMIKIYDPNNLGVSCGYSNSPPLPGWVLSQILPVDVPSEQIVPKNRQRWWHKLWGKNGSDTS